MDGFGDGGDVFGGVAAAAAGEVEEVGVGEVGDVVVHVAGFEIEASGGEGVWESGIGIAGDVGGGGFAEVTKEGLHEVWAEGAVEADGEWIDVGEGVPEGFDFLGGDHGFATTTDGGGDDDGGLGAGFFDGNESGFGVEGVKDGFDHEDVAVGGEEGVDLMAVGFFDLLKGDGAEGGVVWVDDVGEGDGHGADRSGDVAFAAVGLGDFVGFLFGEFYGLDVELPGEVVEELVFEDFFLEEFRSFLAAGFAGVFDEELGLGERSAREGVGFADVGTGFIEALVNVADDIGAGEGEDVAIVEEILGVVFEAVSAGVGLAEFVATNGGAHGSIEDHDAFGKGGFEFGSEVV